MRKYIFFFLSASCESLLYVGFSLNNAFGHTHARVPRRTLCAKHTLELLSKYEVEVAASLVAIYLIEAIRPVKSHKSDHRQVYTYAKSGRTLHIKRIKLPYIRPCITCFNESESIDGCVTKHERIAQLKREAVVGVALCTVRCERTILS